MEYKKGGIMRVFDILMYTIFTFLVINNKSASSSASLVQLAQSSLIKNVIYGFVNINDNDNNNNSNINNKNNNDFALPIPQTVIVSDPPNSGDQVVALTTSLVPATTLPFLLSSSTIKGVFVPTTIPQSYVTQIPTYFQMIFWDLYGNFIDVTKSEADAAALIPQLVLLFAPYQTNITSITIGSDAGRVSIKMLITTFSTLAYNVYQFKQRQAMDPTRNEPIRLILNNTKTLTNIRISCNWTVSGICPTTQCSSGYTCSVDYSCQFTCVQSNASNANLYALLVIPIVLLLVLLGVLLWYFLDYKKRNETNDMIDLKSLGYMDNYSKVGTTRINTINGITMADSNNRNKVYTTMGKTFGFDANHADFAPPDTTGKDRDDLF